MDDFFLINDRDLSECIKIRDLFNVVMDFCFYYVLFFIEFGCIYLSLGCWERVGDFYYIFMWVFIVFGGGV